jgi:hypothetical protein
MADANTLLVIFGSAFGAVVGVVIIVGVGVEIYRRYGKNEFTDPQTIV